jgi:D-aminoacyl-tRNA deacylase
MPNFFIISSSEDIASMNIREKLLNSHLYSFIKLNNKWFGHHLFQLERVDNKFIKEESFLKNKVYLGLTDKSLIFLDDLKTDELNFKPDFLIFASRHASKSARPALLIHTTGNWNDEASFGGNPKEIAYSSALLLKAGFLSLLELGCELEEGKYSIDIEVNHHGPTNHSIPLIFIELGSVKEEWNDQEAGKTVANAIIKSIEKYMILKKQKNRIGLGFGGTHYSPQFKKLIINSNIALSHICPKYFIQQLTEDIIKQIIKKTIESKIDYFIFDWKGLNSQDKTHLNQILKRFNIEIKRAKDFY